MDTNYPTFPDVDGWSETRWVGACSPESGTGLWLHAGRCRQDLDLWWVQTNVYLPGENLVVGRSWCRAGDGTLILNGNLQLNADEEFKRFSLSFDGAGEATTTTALTEKPGGAGIAAPLRLELSAEAAAPPFDAFGGHTGTEAWASRHSQQLYTTTGTVSFEGRQLGLDGVGYIDHSSGPRSFADFGSHSFVTALFPGMGIHAMTLRNLTDEQQMVTGAVFQEQSESLVVAMTMPYLQDLTGGPHRFPLTLQFADGRSSSFDVVIIHTLPVTMTDTNDNLNGIGWDLEDDTLLLTECAARITAADGTIGYGHIERSTRRNRLTQPA
jgi:hypothetical protein